MWICLRSFFLPFCIPAYSVLALEQLRQHVSSHPSVERCQDDRIDMTFTIAGEEFKPGTKAVGWLASLQERQRRILCLRWRNFLRPSPSSDLANSLNKMYDRTVAVLEHKCGQDAPVAQVDAETWDLYWESLSGQDLNPNVTRVQAMEQLLRGVA